MEKTKVAYIAGKVSNLDPWDVKENFEKKESELWTQGYGKIINPLHCIKVINQSLNRIYKVKELRDNITEDRIAIMKICEALISRADEIHLLENWKDSKGTKEEIEYAQKIGVKIIYPNP